MATNPPFNVMEDQTDEDFFDKLVDDDFGPPNLDSGPKFTEGSDSDEAKAFANLSIEDTKGGFEGKVENDGAGLDGVKAEESNALESVNSLGLSDGVIESNNDGIGSEVVPETTVCQSSGSLKSGVKEVGWGSFYADSADNGNHGFGSSSDFFNDFGGGSEDFPANIVQSASNVENRGGGGLDNSVSYEQYQDGSQVYGGSVMESVNGLDLSSSQYWENMYPGWKQDANTGQWYQVDAFDATASMQGSADGALGVECVAASASISDGKKEVNYLQQTSQSVVGTVAETSTTESVSSWNQVSQGNNNGYPEHMVFDPQYPGWYYDTMVGEWRSLDSYTPSAQSSTVQTNDQQNQNGFAFSNPYSPNSSSMNAEYGQADKYGYQGYNNQGLHGSGGESYGSYNQQGLNMWQPQTAAKTDTISNFGGNQQLENLYGSNVSMNNHVDQQNAFNYSGTVPSYDKASQGYAEANGFVGSQSFVHGGNFSQKSNQETVKQNEQAIFSNDYFSSQKQASVPHQSFQSNQQFSYAPNTGRSSAGRPPHALVTFGFGGKLIVMKDSSSLRKTSFSSQDHVGGSISVMNLMEIILGSSDNASSVGGGTCSYFHALCQQSFPGPLVGGNVGNKELNKWIDERIAHCESLGVNQRKGEVLRLLLALLKIACQHYGKLRSPFGTDNLLKESDAPESAVAKLFASAKKNSTHFSEYGALDHCLQNMPFEGQIRATASEVQHLLVSGRKKEALQCAQEGQLWGPALVLASQLGDQYYVDTVKLMALRQLVAGSPLRTLCLLIAGQPAEVFSTDSNVHGGFPGDLSIPQQPVQFGANRMLDDWEENLAVITANRTKDDELVLMHLGDCLWKDRSEITAAHICYLIAEANFESYSDTARLCLIGADHWKHPRTYANPEAIQRTELYEYSKVLGNSQFILLPFQPYKLIYAYMLAEVGKVSDSLKYCQAVLKSLKTGRAPEVETWKLLVLSLEERIRAHQQGGFTTNLAPGKIVGKLLNFFDSTAHRVVGGLPPPAPSASQGSVPDSHHQLVAPRVSGSQSTMTMSSLISSASTEPISEWAADGNKMTMHNRSVSEPDFGRSPIQADSSTQGTPSSTQSKASGSVGSSRFGRFGFGSQLLQKTVGLVLRPRSDKQAKLGEKNKFYYDEKLKRWVEEGVEPTAEAAALAPPPTTLGFQNGGSDYNLKSALKNEVSPTDGNSTFKSPTSTDHPSGIPPIPASSNQFSARGRMGVRARYVDTFNQGGGKPANLFQSPSVPSVKPAVASNAKFFVPAPAPAPAPSLEYSMEAIAENIQEDSATTEKPSTFNMKENDYPQPSTSSSAMAMQRFPSMDNITRKGGMINGKDLVSSNSRRTASWSGSFSDSFSPPKVMESKSPGEALGMTPSSFMPSDQSMTRMPSSSSFGDELHEVEL
ncbi:hypothetical protein POPTR_001G157800v4 [Populus trichocarpa]|uniref:Uncharacterized protein n=2 Tax=Populus trichocarpa TaxID=3694 RepID=A0ACC0TK40_POPTR|nr:protein transport protein SEC16B homolog isoform X2 [Populus trichocarpa]KAI9401709.1 hypothetical protein POPTR_001G157800v4 [Populus trichocarpa]KAI9401711.1 hypothetical protein POPTR_001G157800v4 [Populus trichocarpa]